MAFFFAETNFHMSWVAFFFVACTAASWVTACCPQLAAASSYGKLSTSAGTSPGWGLLHPLFFFPSRICFLAYYCVGLVSIIVLFFLHHTISACDRDTVHVAMMLAGHVSIRLFEAGRALTAPGGGRQHLAVAVVGCFHYFFAAGAAFPCVVSSYTQSNLLEYYLPAIPVWSIDSQLFLRLFAWAVFAWASTHQFICHQILHTLRLRGSYSIPSSPWFDFLTCPHYLLEILCYLAFCLVQPGNSSLWAMLLWVVSNLCITGHKTHQWYSQTFGPLFTQNKRNGIVIPWLY